MGRVELKNWAKEKIKGHLWELLIPIALASFIANFSIGAKYNTDGGQFSYSAGFPIGFFLYFVTVGLAYFMVQFVNDKEHNIKDLVRFTDDYVRTFLTNLLQTIFVFLWTLLLVIPGIIKSIAYAMVPLLLADDKYKDLKPREILQKSEEMMNGHKMDFFVLGLSFIGWHILAVFTLFILEIWIIPYQETAKYKFLDDIKKSNK